MALIQCSECGRQISTNAGACPGCGNPIDMNNTTTDSTRSQNKIKTNKKKSIWRTLWTFIWKSWIISFAIALTVGAISLPIEFSKHTRAIIDGEYSRERLIEIREHLPEATAFGILLWPAAMVLIIISIFIIKDYFSRDKK